MLFIVVVIKKVFTGEIDNHDSALNSCHADHLFPPLLGTELELFIVIKMLVVVKKSLVRNL